ncbi:CPBP family glutamic-type intramembrane protease [Candidatus Kinetoplastidibacterium galati]|uniref:CAAX prenyl protease 2/Lysostaphin resistance protein A-like domain-containing protein n=1 Tax=Candidatus Kinetoplastidibacterium galati TCC219 TaxID=1208921 RepID=M1L8C1_9PROT|nr:CPBP family glutamic-type intramembrane protease [Candidatus Kinetoplastibacterium galatii]AGF48823.1 hypothetical protein ST1E_0354 [Candidatus Kinetoplastibacterium galatii TCC219]
MSIKFISELRDFFCFIRNPGSVVFKDIDLLCSESNFIKSFSISNLMRWACLLWFLNIFILGPTACSVANIIGAKHKIESNIPLFSAIIWAPIIEEMLFRYWMLSSINFIWIAPFFIFILLTGPSFFYSIIIVCTIANMFFNKYFFRSCRYQVISNYNCFPVLFHISNIIFASLHIYNFVFYDFNNWYLAPLLVLPQWCTGLVLGWVRLTKGIIPSILLHSIFNAAPAIIMWFFLRNQTATFVI